MIELISYCIVGGCLLWTLGLVFYLCIERAQDEQELEEHELEHELELELDVWLDDFIFVILAGSLRRLVDLTWL